MKYSKQAGWVLALCLTMPISNLHAQEDAPGSLWMQPSFDCGKASGGAERTVCADPKLAAMDAAIERLFRVAVRSNLKVRDEQRKWMARRGQCVDMECLIDVHEGRLEDLLWNSTAVSTFRSPSAQGTLKIMAVAPNVYAFAGKAFWGKGDNVHDGSSAGVVHIVNGRGTATDSVGCDLSFAHLGDGSWKIMQGGGCQQGVNVSFTGLYRSN